MPYETYYTPKQVRESANYVWYSELDRSSRMKVSEALDMTDNNINQAVKRKKDEDENSLRGIDTCIKLLIHLGIAMNPVPRYVHVQEETEPIEGNREVLGDATPSNF